MNNEQKQIIDEAYENYTQNTPKSHVAGSDSDPMKLSMDWKGKNDYSSGYPILERLSKESFINKIKTDNEFSEKWGLKIEERVLTDKERLNTLIQNEQRLIYEKVQSFKNLKRKTIKDYLDEKNIPTRLITITYKDNKIEIYE